jgi:hypothetical protein
MGGTVAPIFEVTPPPAPPQQNQFEVVPPKKYLPGREFGMDVARGMGLDADAIKAAEDMGGQRAAFAELGSQVLHGLKGVLMDPLSPISGASSNFEEAVKSGSPGQIVGALSSILGGAEGAEKTGVLTKGARESVGEAIRTPEGKLTPGSRATARAAGAGVGGTVGGGTGAILGFSLGPTLMEKLFPESEEAAASREAARAYEVKAKDLMRRGAEQEALDRKAAAQARTAARNAPPPPTPELFPNAISTKPGTLSQLAGPSIADFPPGNPTPFGPSQFVSKFAPPEPSPIAKPKATAAGLPGEGRPATWTNEVVKERAAWGDPDAIEQAQLRGFGRVPLKYSTVETNPRSTTHFDAQGNPVPQDSGFAYRVRDVGEEGVPATASHAHASTTLDEAQSYVSGRESVQGKAQQIVKYDLSKLKEGVDYVRVKRPGQPDWIRQLRPLPESALQVVKAE